jgi:hypothetical protein
VPEPKLLLARNPIPLISWGGAATDVWGKRYEQIGGTKLSSGDEYYHGSGVYKLEEINGRGYLKELDSVKDSQLIIWILHGANL